MAVGRDVSQNVERGEVFRRLVTTRIVIDIIDTIKRLATELKTNRDVTTGRMALLQRIYANHTRSKNKISNLEQKQLVHQSKITI